MLRVALAQVAASGGKEENAAKVAKYIEEIGRSGGVDLAIFPEYSLGARVEEAAKLAEPLDGPTIGAVAKAAARAGINALVGLLEDGGGKYFNTLVLVSRDGEVRAAHRKILLFDALGLRESSYVAAGEPVVTLLEAGGLSLGLATCFELRFPELFRAMALAGADAFAVPAAWYAGPLKEEQWVSAAVARAMDNVAYLVGVGNAARPFVGRSLVVDPWGHVELDLGRGERWAAWRISEEEVRAARAELPLLEIAKNRLGAPPIASRRLELG